MSENETDERDKIRNLVRSLNIISPTDIIACYDQKGHKKHVQACLINCDRIKNKISHCRPLMAYLNRLLSGLSQGKEGSLTQEGVGATTEGTNRLPSRKTSKKIWSPDKDRKHEKVTVIGKHSEKPEKSIIKKKQLQKVIKNTSKNSIKKGKK